MKPLVVSRLLFALLVSTLAVGRAPLADAQPVTPAPTASSNTVVKSTNIVHLHVVNETFAGTLYLPGKKLGLVLINPKKTGLTVFKVQTLTPVADMRLFGRIPLGSTLVEVIPGTYSTIFSFKTTTGTQSITIHSRFDVNQMVNPHLLDI
jgi:hypothetical protein